MARTKNSASTLNIRRRRNMPRVVAVPSNDMKKIDERVRQTAWYRKRKASALGEDSMIESEHETCETAGASDEATCDTNTSEESSCNEQHLTQTPGSDEREGKCLTSEGDEETTSLIDDKDEPKADARVKILKSYKHHIGARIMIGQERKVLTTKQHTTKLRTWKIDKECSAFQDAVKQSPLYALVDASFSSMDKVLISAFVERWQPETNTFHLPFGEMTITLEDVLHITRLPIMGLTVGRLKEEAEEEEMDGVTTEKSVTNEVLLQWCEQLLGIPKEDTLEEMMFTKGKYVRMEWLIKCLAGNSENDNPEVVDFAVRGYLLFILGCTIFADKSGTQVKLVYLDFLRDIKAHGNFAWGAAALAYLYRQLGSASRIDASSISGYLTLLQAWIYERFPAFESTKVANPDVTCPRSIRWKPKVNQSTSYRHLLLRSHRGVLNSLNKDQVNWRPYHANHSKQENISDIVWFSGCLRALDVTEPYHPDRVARQFGHVQLVPRDPLDPVECNRTTTNMKYYKVKHDEPEINYERWNDHLITSAARGPKAVNPHDCSPEYETWFRSHSYPLLTSKGCPENDEIVGPIPTREFRIFSTLKSMLDGTLQKPKATAKDFRKTVTDAISLMKSTVFETMERDRDEPHRDGENVLQPVENDTNHTPRDLVA